MRICGTIVCAIVLALAQQSGGQEIAKENQQQLVSSCGDRPQMGAQACLKGKMLAPGTGGGGYPCSGPEIDQKPEILSSVPPEYTQQAANARYDGTVVVRVVLQADGLGRDFKVVQPLGLGLDEKAIEAVKKFAFRPASRNGHPVEVTVGVSVTFCHPKEPSQ